MNSRLITIVVSLVTFTAAWGCQNSEKKASSEEYINTLFMPSVEDSIVAHDDSTEFNANIPIGVNILLSSYPEQIKEYHNGFLIMRDGTKILYDDGKEKNFVQKLDEADPQDMFTMKYNRHAPHPDYLEDAGRSRCEQLFKKMYGSSAAEVRRNLVNVSWFGHNVLFTNINHAADSLRAVAKELTRYPELKKYLTSSGTFLWRSVRGAKRMSAHSYGIAFDIGVKYSDYWLWKHPGKGELAKISYANKIPLKIVEIFEKHGFIWGGRWYHYDTMHFEFRPEILKANL